MTTVLPAFSVTALTAGWCYLRFVEFFLKTEHTLPGLSLHKLVRYVVFNLGYAKTSYGRA
jgi:hypothetical protein